MKFVDDSLFIYKYFGFMQMLRLVVFPRISAHLGLRFPKYTSQLLSFLYRINREVVSNYHIQQKRECLIIEQEFVIWTCWWQGEESMPDVIKECRKSLQRNANGNNVILITKSNYQEYITLPNFIIKKQEEGKISLSHFSDIIRVTLLRKYGGMWIDSALFVTRPIEATFEFYMPRMRPYGSLCQGKWCFGVMRGSAGHVIFEYMYDTLLNYWRKYDACVDYLMFDGFLRIGYEEIPVIHDIIDSLKVSSPDLHWSRYRFNDEVDMEKLNSLINENQFLSLTWRINYSFVTSENKLTYYGALLEYATKNNNNNNTKE